MRRPYTRRALIRDAARVAAGVVGAGVLARSALAESPLPLRADIHFGGGQARGEWSDGRNVWLSVLGGRVAGVGQGAAYLGLPRGTSSAARAQPCPIFLLDRDCTEQHQEMVFTVSTQSAAVGLVLAGTSTTTYHSVTIEGGWLTLAMRGRADAVVLRSVAVPPLVPGRAYRLVVNLEGFRLSARVEPYGRVLPWQLQVLLEPPPGMVGVLMAGGPGTQPTTLRVLSYTLRSATSARTPMRAQALLGGAPDTSDLAHPIQRVRVVCERPASVAIEVASDPGLRDLVDRSPVYQVSVAPYAADYRFALPAKGWLWWRARLRAPSGAETVTAAQRVGMPDPQKPLVLAAASCSQLWASRSYVGLTRLLEEAASGTPAILAFEGDMGYSSNWRDQCYVVEPDYWDDRVLRFMGDEEFVRFREAVPTCFTMDDHDYGYVNNADRTTLAPWTIDRFNGIHADPSDAGYFDWRYGDVHCMTLDGRRYCDPVTEPESSAKTKLGASQKARLREVLAASEVNLFVLFSADCWASRGTPPGHDTFLTGWVDEFRELMTLFHTTQLAGKRVLIVSGDAHGQRIHYHPDPAGRAGTARSPVIEFICSGLRARDWSMATRGDPTLDPQRSITGHSGLGLIEIDPPWVPGRRVALRAVNGDAGPLDLFPPLVVGVGV